MATLETCIRNFRTNGYATVYIRVTHNREVGYIKTSLTANKKQVKGTKIKDTVLQIQTSDVIRNYFEKINSIDIQRLTCKELINYLTKTSEELSFTEFAKSHIVKLSKKNKTGSAHNYKNALANLQKFLNKKDILFSDINTKNISKWIETLENTKNAKQKYPILIKTLFNAGLLEYNDYDNGILLIKHQPFIKIKIPKSDVPEKRVLNKKEVKSILNFDLSNSIKEVKAPLAKDVAKLVFFLAGINTVDLYNLEKSELKEWKLRYNRTKTKDRRSDKGYIEISVPVEIRYLFDKYKGVNKLFNFSENYHSSAQFNKTVNVGLKDISKCLNLDKDVTSYYFRLSWATIAQNECEASTESVAFCLNHASAHKTTEGYIKKDFTVIDKLNRKVIDYTFKRIRKVKPFRKKKAD